MELETKNHMLMPFLPHELIIQILLRLPVKSLLRFKCVSKSWFSIISSDTHFANSQFQLTVATHTHRALFIATPQIQSIDLETSLDDDSFDLIGFGYDQSTDDYLIVLMSSSTKSSYWQFFSLRANTWKQIDEGTHFHYLNNLEDYPKVGLFFNGAIHWFVYHLHLQKDVILAIDLMERKHLHMDLPDEVDYELDCSGLWVFQEFFSLWTYEDNETVEIWVMKEYKVHSTWTKTHVLHTDAVPTTDFLPLCSTKNGDIVGTDEHTGLVKYNDERQLLGHRSYYNNARGFQVAIYTESLLSLPGDNVQA